MQKFIKIAAPVALGIAATSAFAGNGGSEFSAVHTLLKDWSEGVLGQILAIGSLIVGIAFGLVRQSVIAAVIGISMAVVLSYGPTVIDNIFSLTTASADVVAQVATLSNGLM